MLPGLQAACRILLPQITPAYGARGCSRAARGRTALVRLCLSLAAESAGPGPLCSGWPCAGGRPGAAPPPLPIRFQRGFSPAGREGRRPSPPPGTVGGGLTLPEAAGWRRRGERRTGQDPQERTGPNRRIRADPGGASGGRPRPFQHAAPSQTQTVHERPGSVRKCPRSGRPRGLSRRRSARGRPRRAGVARRRGQGQGAAFGRPGQVADGAEGRQNLLEPVRLRGGGRAQARGCLPLSQAGGLGHSDR